MLKMDHVHVLRHKVLVEVVRSGRSRKSSGSRGGLCANTSARRSRFVARRSRVTGPSGSRSRRDSRRYSPRRRSGRAASSS